MQLKLLTSFTFLAVTSAVSATPFTSPETNTGVTLSTRHPDGLYTLSRSSTGTTVTSFTPEDTGIATTSSTSTGNRTSLALDKRDSIACFQAGVSGADKGSAVNTLANILASYPQVTASGGIAVIQGNSIAYVCNNAGAAQNAAWEDASITDNDINDSCGSSTAGRYTYSSGIEFGRTANGKPFCDGS